MISVCIATYNGEQYILAQLSSILQQLGEDDEIVISDDQSTDKTLELIEQINDSRIKVFHHERYTRHSFPLDTSTHNFQNALMHSRGDIIFLADQDDVWLSGKVAEMCKALHSCDFVVSDCSVTDNDLHIVFPSYFSIKHTNLSPIRNIISCSWLGCCMAFRRCVLEASLPFPDTQVAHDLWLGLVATTTFRCRLIDKPLSLYRRHNNTASSASKASQHSLYFKIKYRYYVIKSLLKRYRSF